MTNGFVLATDPALAPSGLEKAIYAIGNFDGVHLGHRAVIERAISLAKELNDTQALAAALHFAGFLGHFDRNPAEVERCASDLIELSTCHHFHHARLCV